MYKKLEELLNSEQKPWIFIKGNDTINIEKGNYNNSNFIRMRIHKNTGYRSVVFDYYDNGIIEKYSELEFHYSR